MTEADFQLNVSLDEEMSIERLKRSEARYSEAMKDDNKFRKLFKAPKPKLPAEYRKMAGYTELIKDQMTDEQRVMTYEERVKSW